MDVGKVVTAAYHSGGAIGSVWVARLRPFAVVTLVFLAWWAIGPWNYVQAMELERAKAGLTPVAATVSSDSNKIDNAVRQVRRALDRLRAEAGDGGDSLSATALGEAVDELEARFAALEDLDVEILDGFDDVEEHLDRAALPAQIRQRLHHAETAYVQGFRDLRRDIQRTIQEARQLARNGRNARADEVSAQRQALVESIDVSAAGLEAMVGPERHTPLDPDNLPHRPAEPETRQPRLTVDAFTELREAARVTTVVSRDEQDGEEKRVLTAPVIGLGAAATLPEPADLEETIEVQLTPEITALAASLGNEPRRIFDFIHNEIRFTPTHGSVQGAAACLNTRLCNDLDTASLLIALLRASGIPARYALGTVEAPIGEVMNLLGGFTDPGAALNFMASSGTPVAGLNSGGELVAARFEHVWVEAFFDYVPSRGAVAGGEGDTWVPLDASFKTLERVEGIDLDAATGFSPLPFFDQLLDAATVEPANGSVTDFDVASIEQTFETLQDQIRDFVTAEDDTTTVLDLIGGTRVVPDFLSLLPASLPYRVLVRASSFAEVPGSLRHTLRLEVASDSRFALFPELTFSTSLPELAGKRITLGYSPASDADQATLESFLPQTDDPTPEDLPTSLPAFLVRMTPELRIDGEVVARGGTPTLGQTGSFRLTFGAPGAGSQTVDNLITAGSYNAVVLNLGVVEDPESRRDVAEATLERLRLGDVAGLTKDDVMGDFLHSAGLLYWNEVELYSRIARGLDGVVTSRLPSEGIFTYDLKVALLFGSPRTVSVGALLTDVDTDVQAVAALDGDPETPIDYLALTGAASSRGESAIYDQFVSDSPDGRGVNAVSYIEAAVRQGIPVFQIDATNVGAVLPLLQVSSAIKTDIRNSVNAGRTVTIPQREFVKDGFTGVGYIVFDPDTGAGGYLISTGLAGGGFDLFDFGPFGTFLIGVLLAGLGVLVTGGLLGVLIGILGALFAIYSALVSLQNFSQRNPDVSGDDFEMFFAGIALFAMIGVILSLAAISGAGLALVALVMYWAVASVLFTGAFENLFQQFLNRFRMLDQIPLQSAVEGLREVGDALDTHPGKPTIRALGGVS